VWASISSDPIDIPGGGATTGTASGPGEGDQSDLTATALARLIETPLSRARTATADLASRQTRLRPFSRSGSAAPEGGSRDVAPILQPHRPDSSAEMGNNKEADPFLFWADVKGRYGRTALAVATLEKSLRLVDRLLDVGADPNGLVGSSSDSITTAAATGNLLVLKAMLQHGHADLGHKRLLQGEFTASGSRDADSSPGAVSK